MDGAPLIRLWRENPHMDDHDLDLVAPDAMLDLLRREIAAIHTFLDRTFAGYQTELAEIFAEMEAADGEG